MGTWRNELLIVYINYRMVLRISRWNSKRFKSLYLCYLKEIWIPCSLFSFITTTKRVYQELNRTEQFSINALPPIEKWRISNYSESSSTANCCISSTSRFVTVGWYERASFRARISRTCRTRWKHWYRWKSSLTRLLQMMSLLQE